MASTKELSQLTLDSYSSRGERQGFEESGFVPYGEGRDLPNGLQIQAYINEPTREVAIATAGTNDLDDVSTFFDYTLGGYDDQFREAINYAERIKREIGNRPDAEEFQFLVTGHSHGGGVSQVLSYTYKWDGATFESPAASAVVNSQGYRDHLMELGVEAQGPGNLVNYQEQGSVVSSIPGRGYVGDRIELDLTPDTGTLISGALMVQPGLAGKLLGLTGLAVDQWGEGGQHKAANFVEYFSNPLDPDVIQDWHYIGGSVDGWYRGDSGGYTGLGEWGGRASPEQELVLFAERARRIEHNQGLEQDGANKGQPQDSSAIEPSQIDGDQLEALGEILGVSTQEVYELAASGELKTHVDQRLTELLRSQAVQASVYGAADIMSGLQSNNALDVLAGAGQLGMGLNQIIESFDDEGKLWDDSTDAWAQAGVSAANFLDDVLNGDELGALSSGVYLLEDFDHIHTDSDLPGMNSGLTNALSLYTALDNGNAASIGSAGYRFAEIASDQQLSAALNSAFNVPAGKAVPYASYITAGVQLVEGDVEQAGVTALGGYLMSSGHPVAMGVGAALSVFGGSLFVGETPRAWADFKVNDDGSIGFDAGSNGAGDGLVGTVEELADGLAPVIANVQSYGVEIQPGSLPRIGIRGDEYYLEHAGATRLIEDPEAELPLLMEMSVIGPWMRENGIELWSRSGRHEYLGDTDWSHSVEGTGVFAGGGQKQYAPTTIDGRSIVSLNDPALRSVAQQLAEVQRTWRVDRGLFAGEGGALLAVGLGAGLVQYAEIAEAISGSPDPASLMEHPDTADRAPGADAGNIVAAGYGVIDATGTSEDEPTASLQGANVDSAAFYSGRRSSVYDDALRRFDALEAHRIETDATGGADDSTVSLPVFLLEEAGSTPVDPPARIRALSRGDEFGEPLPRSGEQVGNGDNGSDSGGGTGDESPEVDSGENAAVPVSHVLTMLEDRYLVTSAEHLLEHDVEGATLVSLEGARNGAVEFDTSGDIRFTPPMDFHGKAGFTYQVRTDDGRVETRQVKVIVTGRNDRPDAVDDGPILIEDHAVALEHLLSNDRDVDGGPLHVAAVSQISIGRVETDTSGAFWYTPPLHYTGKVELTYLVEDSEGGRAAARATLTIENDGNDPPVVPEVVFRGGIEGHSYTFHQSDLLQGSLDPEGGSLTIESIAAPSGAGIDWHRGSGEIMFTPAADFHGLAPVSYEVSDSAGLTTDATAYILFENVSDPFTAGDTRLSVDENQVVVLSPEDLLPRLDIDNPDGGDVTIVAARMAAGMPGRVNHLPDGSVQWIPPQDYSGSSAFEVRLFNGIERTVSRVDLDITEVNDPPRTRPDNFEAIEDQAFELNAAALVANDLDPEADAFSVTDVRLLDPQAGALTFDPDTGVTRLEPSQNFFGEARLEYTVTERVSGMSNTGLATVRFAPVDDRPMAKDKSFTLNEDQVIVYAAGTLLSQTVDADGEPVTITAVHSDDPARGTATLHVDGGIRFTPAADFFGETGFEFEYTDGVTVDTASVSLDVAAANDAPVGQSHQFTGALEDQPYEFPESELLAGALDVEGDAILVESVALPGGESGQLEHDPDVGRIVYAPGPDFFGEVHLEYVLRDARGARSTETATILVQNVEDDFALSGQRFIVPGDEIRVFTSWDLLDASADVDGDALTISAVRMGDGDAGQVELLEEGRVRFIPESTFSGYAQFEYDVTDGTHTHTAITGLEVQPPPEVPHRLTGAVEDQVFEFTTGDLPELRGDATALSEIQVADSSAGSLAWDQGSGELAYTPAPDFFGEALLSYHVMDTGSGQTQTGTAAIVVQAVDDPPVISDKDVKLPALNLDEDEVAVFAESILLDGLTDPDDEALRITATRMVDDVYGQVSLTPGGAVRFEPAPDYTGEAQFEIDASDGNSTVTAIMTPMLWPINDAPRVHDDHAVMEEDSTLTIAGADLLAKDVDVDGPHEELRIVGPWAASVGHTRYDAEADQIHYTPAADSFGPAWVDYIVEDAHGAFSVARLDVTIDNVYDPVAAVDDTIVIEEDTDYLFDPEVFTGNDRNPDRGPLDIVALDDSGISHGQLTLTPGGRIDYQAAPDYAGDQQFTYTVRDESGFESSAAVRLVVEEVNDAPRVSPASGQMLEDHVEVFEIDRLLDNAFDIEDDWLQVVAARSVLGTVHFDELAGEIAFSPVTHMNSDLNGGPLLFEYLVQDEKGAETWGAVDIDVLAVNDPPRAGDDVLFAWESGPGGYINPVPASALLTNDEEVDGESIHIDRVTPGGGRGTVFLDTVNDELGYRAETGFVGQDTFTYRVTDEVIEDDGSLSADTGTVSVHVLDNRAPSAHDFATIALEDTVLYFDLDDFAAHVDDPDLGILELREAHEIVSVGDSVNGHAALEADGGVRFTPTADYNSMQHGGTASISYVVEDIVGNRSEATAYISYTPVNDDPVVVDDVISQTVHEEQTAFINISDLLANDFDIDDIPGESSVVFGGLIGNRSDHGSISVQGDQIRYAGDRNFFGGDSFKYRIVDGEGGEGTGRVHLQVANVNDKPVVEFDSAQADDSGTNTIGGLLNNDVDADGETLRIVNPSQGSVVSNGTAIRFDAENRGHDYTTTITYGVTDGQATVQSRLDVHVLHVERPPTSLTRIQTDPDSVFVAGNDPDTPDPAEKWEGGSVSFAGYTWDAEVGSAPGTGAGQNGLFIDLKNQFGHPVALPDPNQATMTGTGTFSYTIEVSDGENQVYFNGSISTPVSLHNTNFSGAGKPVVIDLNRDGLDLLGPEDSNAKFDWNNDGWKEATGWIAGRGDALLVYDHDNDQRVSRSDEISFVQYLNEAQSDLEGLRGFDTNNDGLFDALDDEWSQFGLWIDDGDAESESGELVDVEQSGIESLSLVRHDNGFETNGNAVYGTADVVYTDGFVGQLGDVAFATRFAGEDRIMGTDPEDHTAIAQNRDGTGSLDEKEGSGTDTTDKESQDHAQVSQAATTGVSDDSDKADSGSYSTGDGSGRSDAENAIVADDATNGAGISAMNDDADDAQAAIADPDEAAVHADTAGPSDLDLPADDELDRMAQADNSQAAAAPPDHDIPAMEIDTALSDPAGGDAGSNEPEELDLVA